MKAKTVIALLVVCVFLTFAQVAVAQAPLMTIKTSGLNCTTRAGLGTSAVMSYSFGASVNASTTVTAGGATTTAPVIAPLSVTKQADECSPALLAAVTSGQHFPRVDLVQYDGTGKPVLTISLDNAMFVAFQVSATASSAAPQEPIQLMFERVRFTGLGGATMCWNVATRSRC